MISLIFLLVAALGAAGFVLALRDEESHWWWRPVSLIGLCLIAPYFWEVWRQSGELLAGPPALPARWVAVAISVGLGFLLWPMLRRAPTPAGEISRSFLLFAPVLPAAQSGDQLLDRELEAVTGGVLRTVEAVDQMTAGATTGESAVSIAMIVTLVPAVLVIWRSLDRWASPFLANWAEERRLKIENDAHAERLEIDARFKSGD